MAFHFPGVPGKGMPSSRPRGRGVCAASGSATRENATTDESRIGWSSERVFDAAQATPTHTQETILTRIMRICGIESLQITEVLAATIFLGALTTFRSRDRIQTIRMIPVRLLVLSFNTSNCGDPRLRERTSPCASSSWGSAPAATDPSSAAPSAGRRFRRCASGSWSS